MQTRVFYNPHTDTRAHTHISVNAALWLVHTGVEEEVDNLLPSTFSRLRLRRQCGLDFMGVPGSLVSACVT